MNSMVRAALARLFLSFLILLLLQSETLTSGHRALMITRLAAGRLWCSLLVVLVAASLRLVALAWPMAAIDALDALLILAVLVPVTALALWRSESTSRRPVLVLPVLFTILVGVVLVVALLPICQHAVCS